MNDARDLRWLALPLLTVWLVTQCYSGLWHDSVLYSFQAMAHLHPELLGNDLYLRYGSQDQYSVFPRLYAILIRWLGLENAAELLTLAMQALLLYAIWRLAVRLMPHNVAVFALAAAICLPNGYGAREVFHYIESFVTPRMAAEALTLCALAGWLRSPRSWWSLLLWLGACVLHPLMALAGAVMAVWLFLLDGRRRLAALLVVLGLATVLLASRFDSWRMDDYWFATIRAGLHYLMLGDWNEPSFVTTLLPLVLLGCAVRALAGTLPGQAAAAALATGVSGLVLTYLGADLLHLTLVVQAQPWRWMWLAALVAAVVLPPLVLRLWSLNAMGRAAILLLATVYCLHGLRPVLILSPLLIGAVWLATNAAALQKLTGNQLQLCLRGAQAAALIAVAWNIADKVLVSRVVKAPGYVPTFYAKVYLLTSDGALPTLCVLLAIASWFLARRARRTAWWYAAWSVLAAAALWLALPNYRGRIFTPPVQAVFTRWQSLIPPRTVIFIPEDALAGWTSLMRPGFFTLEQSASQVFSRDAAMELRRRSLAATSFLSRHHLQIWPEFGVNTDAEPRLDDLCASTGVRFIITRSDLHQPALDTMPDAVGERFAGLKLYACASQP